MPQATAQRRVRSLPSSMRDRTGARPDRPYPHRSQRRAGPAILIPTTRAALGRSCPGSPPGPDVGGDTGFVPSGSGFPEARPGGR
jgi:hypothetical protein